MLILKKVAVTGGLASGKTSVCQILEKCGAHVINADQIVHQLLSPNSIVGPKIIQLFGQDVVKGDHFDRQKIAEIVFSNPEKLKALESLIHPVVFDEIEKRYQKIKNNDNEQLFVAEIPLFFESEYKANFDAVITVVSDEELSKKRFYEATKHSEEEFDRRMARQLHPDKKKEAADYVIYNNGTLDQLEDETIKIYKKIARS